MPKKRDFLQPELTLAKLSIHVMFSKFLQNQPQMLFMICFYFGEDQNIINEDHNKPIEILHNTLFIIYMKYVGALVSPKDITVYSYNPYRVVKAVLGMSDEQILN